MLALLLFCIFFNTNAITTFHDRHSSETIAFAMDTYNERLVRKKKQFTYQKTFGTLLASDVHVCAEIECCLTLLEL